VLRAIEIALVDQHAILFGVVYELLPSYILSADLALSTVMHVIASVLTGEPTDLCDCRIQ